MPIDIEEVARSPRHGAFQYRLVRFGEDHRVQVRVNEGIWGTELTHTARPWAAWLMDLAAKGATRGSSHTRKKSNRRTASSKATPSQVQREADDG